MVDNVMVDNVIMGIGWGDHWGSIGDRVGGPLGIG